MGDVDRSAFYALQKFCEAVTQKISAPSKAEPEAQLHGPLLDLFHSVEQSLTIQAESRADGRVGIPDFAILRDRLLIGYVETKAPGTGADASRFTKGHNARQWQRFQDLPNILYTDGNEWALFQKGELVGRVVRLNGDVAQDGKKAAAFEDAKALRQLLAKFLSWEVIPPTNAKKLAELLAPICRMLRDEVADALQDPRSPLVRLANEWREHLFPDASDKRFADAYAQTVTYALLLARAENADPLNLHEASEALKDHEHTMLSRALQVMTDPQAQKEIRPALRLVQRMVASVNPDMLTTNEKIDPWLYFYEDFLAAYDPELRKDAGAYYTPVEVVHAQVRLVDDLLVNRLGMEMGFAEGGSVTTLDPAVGTGTYLLGIIDHAMTRVAAEEGKGSVRARASLLWQNLHGFELMVSPYAVAELRLTQSLRKYKGTMPGGGPPIYLTNTLESPFTAPPAPPLFYEPIAQEHHRALQVKDRIPVRVCIGNPPYDRHEAATAENRASTGAWVRWGKLDEESGKAPFDDYTIPARQAGHGQHLKNLYNLYVYFWRWAFWKTFEHQLNPGAGIVTYISASSYIDGDAFVGMREHMRRTCDEIWIIDLGGEGRGTRRSDNVFAIQTPVAIAIAMRATRHTHTETPARVYYTCIEGTRDNKLSKLDNVHCFDDLTWEDCPDDWHAPFRPAGKGAFFDWPLLTDLMPWQVSGSQVKRIWPVAADEVTLKRRWQTLMKSDNRAEAFKETRDRKIDRKYPSVFSPSDDLQPIANLEVGAAPDSIRRYAYRSFDRQYVIADNRVGDYMRPVLWQGSSERQVYFTSLLTKPLGKGPALTVAADVPDLDHFSGRGAKDTMPLYRDAAAEHPNILPGLLDVLAEHYGHQPTPEDWAGYLYAILAHPAYSERFHDELSKREVRVPITTDAGLFKQVAETGRRLIWLHTYGERMVPESKRQGQVPRGKARCTVAVPDEPDGYPESFNYDPDRHTLIVGGGEFAPVLPKVWEFEVSGLKVVQSWLGYRMKRRSGRRSSSLDDIGPERWTAEFTTELLNLLWTLEATVATYPEQAQLLDDVLAGEMVKADELPDVPKNTRKAPKVNRRPDLFDE